MAGGPAWVKRDMRESLRRERGWTPDEKLAFRICEDLVAANGGPIPDDARWIAGSIGWSVRKWRAVREALVGRGALLAVDNGLTSPELQAELERIGRRSRENPEIISGKSRDNFAENEAHSSDSKDLPGDTHARARAADRDTETAAAASCDRIPGKAAAPLRQDGDGVASLEEERRRDVVRSRAVPLFERLRQRLGAPNRYWDELGVVVGWLEAGSDPDLDVWPAVEKVLARERGQLPMSLGYFTPVVAEVAEKRRKGGRRGGRRAAADAPVTPETATPEAWGLAIERWAAARARYGPQESRWPDHARWPVKALGPPPGTAGCRAPPELVAEVLGQAGADHGNSGRAKAAARGPPR